MSNNPNEMLGESLFGKVRRKVLSTFVLNPERSFYLLELIRLLNCGRGAVQREVARLSKAGIILRKKIGNQVHYTANTDNLIYKELRSIFSKTTGLIDLLDADLRSCSDSLGMAFIFGDYARGTADEHSRVNLVVIGDTTMDAVRACTAGFSKEAARELHITVLTTSELKRRLISGDRRIQEILADRKIFLSGGQRELQVLTTTGDDLFAGIF
ncbi:MAG: nucleotidyltransferase domain-containing protein [Candidatus Sabulitectum sp.]|nr:nucleotidyltransferase domain-containing protein [Candidatus Sabulitectum sp.]